MELEIWSDTPKRLEKLVLRNIEVLKNFPAIKTDVIVSMLVSTLLMSCS